MARKTGLTLLLCTAALISSSLAIAVGPAGRPAMSAQQALAKLPPDRLQQLSPATWEAINSGTLSGEELLASLGLAPVVRAAAPPDVQTKAFLQHWMYNYTCLIAGIGEDPIGEAGIDGRCSNQPMTSTPGAPSLSPSYNGSQDGSMYTGYYNAPSDSATCTTTHTNLTRYFVAWIYAPRTRSGYAFIGAADYYKLWVNGTLVSSRTTGGMKLWTVDEYSAPVTLEHGWNLVVFRHTFPQLGPYTEGDPNLNYKYFSVRFAADAAGTPMTDLVAGHDPNCLDTSTDLAVYSRAHVANIAHITGVGGAQWRTDVTLANNTFTRWQYRLRYYREGSNSGTADSDQLVTLAPFESRTWTDALVSLFGRTGDQKGTFVVTQMYYSLLTEFPYGNGALRTRVYNQSAAGTYGMSVPARYFYEGTSWGGVFYGVRNGQYRTNFGLAPMVNAGAACRVTVWLVDPALGLSVTKEYPGITGYWQLNNVFADMGVGTVVTNNATMYFRIDDNATGTYWMAYMTANDGNPATGSPGTSDPVFETGNYMWAYPDWP
ncbi:MAG: hypothetical protein HY825_07730 [Acidobacteria bacterium]|nr:hypothetical protein [Acidobacteriota bacterium]